MKLFSSTVIAAAVLTVFFALCYGLYLVTGAYGVYALAVVFAIVSVLMMLVILMQKPKGGGLSGAFGGGGGNESAFVGAQVGDVLTLVTVMFFVAFIGLGMGLTWTINPTPAPANTAVATGAGVPAAPADASAEEAEPAAEGEEANDAPIETGAVEEAAETVTSEAVDAADPATP